ncbi:hypothetical protein HMI01_07490 [Halolactibacillus miurensis]|uniref:Uncharacterized protein n=1 Tax=Halolactibacillus miurensis TaxID=306541 RepID=A0A1I6PLP0_9BACI|nr:MULTISPECIES: hypothetical protein [Halolactibacillus]GEM03761.1 hypothetical protein HMI01_07490 [Halolactibacillus miurensis]SFS41112.1 hypothetical protein SAMN05421668_10267 [Halolactibacillus miurensis]
MKKRQLHWWIVVGVSVLMIGLIIIYVWFDYHSESDLNLVEEKETNDTLRHRITQLEGEISRLDQEVFNAKNQNERLQQEIDIYLDLDQYAKEYIHALIDQDMDVLEELTSPSLMVYSDRIEKTENGSIVPVYFGFLRQDIEEVASIQIDLINFGYANQGEFFLQYELVDQSGVASHEMHFYFDKGQTRWQVRDLELTEIVSNKKVYE